MFKKLKKWTTVSLTAVMLCGLMVPQNVFAEEADKADNESAEEVVVNLAAADETDVEETVTIDDLAEKATAGDTGTFTVKVAGDAEDLEGCYLEIHDGSGYCSIQVSGGTVEYDEYGAVVKNLFNGQELAVTYTLPDWMSGIVYMDAILYDAENSEIVYEEKSVECTGLVTASLSFAPTTTVVAGVAYPYSVTVTNQSEKELEKVAVKVYSSWHIQRWSAVVTGDAQDGVSFADGCFTIAELKPHTSVTLSGTITIPEAAVGESTHVMANVYLNGDMMNSAAYAGSEDDATGDADYYFKVVASDTDTEASDGDDNGVNGEESAADDNSENGSGKVKAAKTADTAQIAGLMALMAMAMAAVAVMKTRKVSR